jgi:type VI protein secretion system component Hcp
MPSDAFMEVSTIDIVGESGDESYGEHTPYGMFEIASMNFSHGESAPDEDAAKPKTGGVNPPQGGGPAALGTKDKKKTNVGEVTIEKAIDKSSTWLFLHSVNKELMMDWAIIYTREAGDPNATPWLRLEFRKVRVTHFEWSLDPGGGGEESMKTEKVTFSFQTMLINYYPQMSTGAHDPKLMTASWNFNEPKASVDPIS